MLFTLLASGASDWDAAQIVAQSLETGERRVLVAGGRDARYVHTGHVVYAVEGTVFAAPFDTRSLSVLPGTVPLVDGVVHEGSAGWASAFDVSREGTLVYVPLADEDETGSVLGWVDRTGEMTPLMQSSIQYQNPRLSPDGAQALTLRCPEEALVPLLRGSLSVIRRG